MAGSKEEVRHYIDQCTSTVGAGTLCSICGKIIRHLGNVRRHFLDKHVTLGVVGYNCPACHKVYKSKNSMSSHIAVSHKDWGGQFDYKRFEVRGQY